MSKVQDGSRSRIRRIPEVDHRTELGSKNSGVRDVPTGVSTTPEAMDMTWWSLFILRGEKDRGFGVFRSTGGRSRSGHNRVRRHRPGTDSVGGSLWANTRIRFRRVDPWLVETTPSRVSTPLPFVPKTVGSHPHHHSSRKREGCGTHGPGVRIRCGTTSDGEIRHSGRPWWVATPGAGGSVRPRVPSGVETPPERTATGEIYSRSTEYVGKVVGPSFVGGQR